MADIQAGIKKALADGVPPEEVLQYLASREDVGPGIQAALADNVPATDILNYLSGAQPPKPDSLGRQAGLAVRPIAQSVLTGGGMLPLVVDPAINFLNLGAKTNLPTMTQAVQSTLTRAGFPEPRTSTERIVQDVAAAGYGTAGLAKGAQKIGETLVDGVPKAALRFFSESPQAQLAAGTTATTAGGMLREGGATPGQQIAGALLAGTVAPGSARGPVTGRAIGAPSALLQPFTQGGREVIVGNVLRNLATDPDRAAINLANVQPLVPGVRVTTAAGARDPGLAAAETTIRALDQSGLFGQTLSQNQQALLQAYRQVAGKPGSIPKAEAKRTEVTAPMREAAFEGSTVDPAIYRSSIDLVVNKTIDDILASPVGVRKDVDTAMSFARDRIARANNPRELYEVRKDLAAAAQGKYNQEVPSLRLAKGQLTDVIKAVDDVIEAGAPGYKNYMRQYKKSSSAIDQMSLLQEIEGRVTTGMPNLMTGDPVLAAGALRRHLALRSEELGTELSPAAQRKVDNIIMEINRGQAATAPGVRAPGSDTFRNMSMGNLIGRVFSESMATNTTLRTMTRPLDFLYKLPDDQVRQLLVEAMLDPKLASMMMGKASVMKVEPVAKALRLKAEQLGFGSALGAQQGLE
jgi:hypothetical protein